MNYKFQLFRFGARVDQPRAQWFYRTKRYTLQIITLGVGYYIYRNLLFYTMLNNNETLDLKQTQQLAQKNFTMRGSQMILGHHINMQPNHSSRKQRIVVIGAGQTGTAASRKLLERGYEVILIDSKEQLSPNDYLDLLHEDIGASSLIKSLFIGKTNWNIFLESYFTLWFVNNLVNSIKAQFNGRNADPQPLNSMAEVEFNQLKKDIPQLQAIQILPILNLDTESLDSRDCEQLLKISTCTHQPNQTLQIDEAVQSYCKATYPSTFHQFQLCNVSNFVFDYKGQMIGLLTNTGFIKADKVLVTAGYASKILIQKLGYRLPIIPNQVRTLQTAKTLGEGNILQKYIIQTPQMTTYEMNGRLYVMSHAEITSTKFDQVNMKANQTLVDQFNKVNITPAYKQQFKSQIPRGDFVDDIQFQSITPDGQPIVDKIPGFPNVYICIGNNGLSHMASAQIISEIVVGASESLQSDLRFERFYLV